jgi:hypothetical protein
MCASKPINQERSHPEHILHAPCPGISMIVEWMIHLWGELISSNTHVSMLNYL